MSSGTWKTDETYEISALDYVHLIDRRVRFERYATHHEQKNHGTPKIGMDAIIVEVEDVPNGVKLVGDDGHSITIHGYDRKEWTWWIRTTRGSQDV